jgi:hypothetical protein
MLHSPSPSPTDPLLSIVRIAGLGTAAALGLAGCSDDACGPGGAPGAGLVASSTMFELVYEDLSSLIANDCPDPAAPEGVISLTIEGHQTGNPAGLITLCVPRPDLLMQGDRTLGAEPSSADIQVVDLTGNTSGCSFLLDNARPPAGTAQATGVCDNGDSPEGFALSFDGEISLRRTCFSSTDTVTVFLRGRVAVRKR